jgi:lipoate-protein ligase A
VTGSWKRARQAVGGSCWRLLDSGPGPGDWNMALDRALLEQVAAGASQPVIRFYSWSAPTLSFGRMQRPSRDLLRLCAGLGVAVVRRPTGGKAILHHREVTFSIIAPAAGMGSVIASYRTFARAIGAGLRRLGVDAQLCEPPHPPRRDRLLCFAAPAQCDLEIGGRKLLGSAQARHSGALLQQNSLPLVLASNLKERLFGTRSAAEETRIATDLTAALAREPSCQEVKAAILSGFESELETQFEAGVPTEAESVAAEALRDSFAL